jgi:hypothetical protein
MHYHSIFIPVPTSFTEQYFARAIFDDSDVQWHGWIACSWRLCRYFPVFMSRDGDGVRR